MNEYTMECKRVYFSFFHSFAAQIDNYTQTVAQIMCMCVYLHVHEGGFALFFHSLCKSNQNYSLLSNTSVNDRKVFVHSFVDSVVIYLLLLLVLFLNCVFVCARKESTLIECDWIFYIKLYECL